MTSFVMFALSPEALNRRYKMSVKLALSFAMFADGEFGARSTVTVPAALALTASPPT